MTENRLTEEHIAMENIKQRRVQWILDPVLFCREVLGMYQCKCDNGKACELDHLQTEILYDFARLTLCKMKAGLGYKLDEEEASIQRRIGESVQAGKGVGKTAIAAIIAIWFFFCFDRAEVIVIGPKYDQIKATIWPEIAKWLSHAERLFGENCLVSQLIDSQSDKIFMKDVPKTERGKNWLIRIQTYPKNANIEDQKIAVQGNHNKYLLFIIDEASGIPDYIFESIDQTLIDAVNLVFAIYNPNKNTGWAIETQGRMKERWVTHRINAESSGRVKRDQIEYMAEKYGRNSNKYRVGVLGLPPINEDGALISWDWISTAQDRGYLFEPELEDPVIFGIDPGGGGEGDITCICIRKGYHILAFETTSQTKTEELVRWAEDFILLWDPKHIFIDRNGLGKGMYDLLKGKYKGIKGLYSMNKSTAKDRFYRLRDELFWSMREEFEKENLVIHPDKTGRHDDELQNELSLLKYDDDYDGNKIKVLSKKDAEYKKEMRAVLGYTSPNKADSLSLTFYYRMEGLKGGRKDALREKRKRLVKKIKNRHNAMWMAG